MNLKFKKLLNIWNSKFNPFSNYDELIPNWVYLKFAKYPMHKILAFLYWYFWRNLLYNLSYYWIGMRGYLSVWKVWHPERSWNLILPFFSFRGKRFEFYIGWRPKEGGGQVFGIALRRRKRN